MRILHISTRLILGGSQENTVLSCEGQARLGHEVHLAFGPIYGPEGSLLERVEKFRTADGRGITTHVVPHLVREVNPLTDFRARVQLARLIRTVQPDVVHTHSSKAGVLGRWAAWEERLADSRSMGIVHTIHGPPFMPIEGSARQRLAVRVKNGIYERAERSAARQCHVIVSVADAMTKEFLARGIGTPEQYVTVRSGIKVEPFLTPARGQTREEVRAALGIAPETFVVGTVARLAEHKGHDDLLKALADPSPSPPLLLLWVGDGWWKDGLVQRALDLGWSVREFVKGPPRSWRVHLAGPGATREGRDVDVLGMMAPESIPGLIRAMDVLAHPSYREGLPRTVPQALLCGVCPVAYDCDGTGEVCRDMQTGRLVPTGDWKALREAILWCMAHPAERAEMAARGREECRTAFSAETMVAELEKVYARAIGMAREK